MLLFCSVFLVPLTYSANYQQGETYTLSGYFYTADCQLANSTSIKVDSMASGWSQDGYYEYSGITPGEHTVLAYFINDVHTVAYR